MKGFIPLMLIGLLALAVIGGLILSSTVHIQQLEPKNSSTVLPHSNLSKMNNTNNTNNEFDAQNFDLWKWLLGFPIWEILWNIITVPFVFFKWVAQALAVLACWLIKFFNPTIDSCPIYLGYILLIPILVLLLWGLWHAIQKYGSKFAMLTITILGAMFAVGVVLMFLGVL